MPSNYTSIFFFFYKGLFGKNKHLVHQNQTPGNRFKIEFESGEIWYVESLFENLDVEQITLYIYQHDFETGIKTLKSSITFENWAAFYSFYANHNQIKHFIFELFNH